MSSRSHHSCYFCSKINQQLPKFPPIPNLWWCFYSVLLDRLMLCFMKKHKTTCLHSPWKCILIHPSLMLFIKDHFFALCIGTSLMFPHLGEPGSDSLPFLADDISLYQQQKACLSREFCGILEAGSTFRPSSPHKPSRFSLCICSHSFLGFAQPAGPKTGGVHPLRLLWSTSTEVWKDI